MIAHLKSWLFHGTHTAAWGFLGVVAGGPMWAIACALCYVFREVWQHNQHGTHGFLAWLDRIMDASVSVAVALTFAVWMR